MTHDQFMKNLRTMCENRQMSNVARDLGVAPANLSVVLIGRVMPGPKLVAALGLRRVVTYHPVEKSE